jgi:SAM-dependent methyltransferase
VEKRHMIKELKNEIPNRAALPRSVKADLQGDVKMPLVFKEYFKSEENARLFIEIGLKGLHSLPQQIRAVDFGGGTGVLAKEVRDYLVNETGRKVEMSVVDGNYNYLQEAHDKGLNTTEQHLASLNRRYGTFDLIITRAVFHYNNIEDQIKILKNVTELLEPGGRFLHQMSSGSLTNVDFRTRVANSKSLERTSEANSMRFLTEKEYLLLCNQVGLDTQLAGYAPSNSWTLEEMFDRFHKNEMKGMTEEEKSQFGPRKKFIKEFSEFANSHHIDGVRRKNNQITVEYQYPIFISQKATLNHRRNSF